MPTLPAKKTYTEMNGTRHTFLMDDRFNDFANQAYGFLADELTPENVFRVLELALAYENDVINATINDKPEKWIVD